MRNKFIVLLVSVLILNCNDRNNDDEGFVENNLYDFTKFIDEVESGENSIFILAETVEVISDNTENSNNFSRIITIKKEEESQLQTLYFHLNLDNEGNTIGISSIIYEVYDNDILNTYSYSEDINSSDDPQYLNYTIMESTDVRFIVNMSVILSKYSVTEATYITLDVSDFDLDIMF